MKYRLVNIGDELVHTINRRHVLVKIKHDLVRNIDILWLDTHTLEERVNPEDFDPVSKAERVCMPKK